MTVFDKARENMVECQLMPDGVSADDVLKAFRYVPREQFLPQDKQSFAYVDDNIVFDDGTFLLNPSTHALMVQALNIEPDEAVLNIGCCTGYSSAILGHLSKTVITLSIHENAATQGKARCEEQGLYNVAFFDDPLFECCPEYAPYSAMIFNGSVAEIPETMLKNLAHNGRMVYIDRPAGSPIGKVKMIHKIQDDEYSRINLFDAVTPYVLGFEPKTVFSL